MSTQLWRALLILSASMLVLGLGLGAAPAVRWAQAVSTSYGAGFLVIVGLMTLLVLISIVRMPLSLAGRPHRRHR